MIIRTFYDEAMKTSTGPIFSVPTRGPKATGSCTSNWYHKKKSLILQTRSSKIVIQTLFQCYEEEEEVEVEDDDDDESEEGDEFLKVDLLASNSYAEVGHHR